MKLGYEENYEVFFGIDDVLWEIGVVLVVGVFGVDFVDFFLVGVDLEIEVEVIVFVEVFVGCVVGMYECDGFWCEEVYVVEFIVVEEYLYEMCVVVGCGDKVSVI